MVGLRTGSVDLTAHFLDDEAELAARERLGIDRVQKVPAVLAETDLLLIDVQFLEIEDKFLLEAGRVDLLPQLAEILHQLLPDGIDPLLLKGLDLVFKLHNRSNPGGHIPVEGLSFLRAVVVDSIEGFLDGLGHQRPVLFSDDVGLPGVDDIRKPEHGRQNRPEGTVTGIALLVRAGFLDLTEVFVEKFAVEGLGSLPRLRFPAHEEVDSASGERFGDPTPHNKFLVLGEQRRLDVGIRVLSVESSDFDGEFTSFEVGLSLAVAGH